MKIKGFVETLEGDIFSAREQMRISIICPKPFWEDMQAIYDELSTIIHRFHFPFSIEEPIPISDYVGTEGVTVENKGDIEIGFLCKVYFRSKANPTLTKSEFQDPIPSDVLQRYAYIPLTIDEYNPETDTLHVTSTHQPSDSIGNRYITIGGTRYMERIYKTNQSGSTKTLDITRAEGVPAKDLRYFEHHWNDVSLWFEGTVSRVERPDNVPEDLSQSFVEVRGKRGDALAEVLLMPDECSVTVSSEHITVTINADLQSRNYTGLRIIIVSSDSVDVSGATGITRRSITYQWRSEISWYPCHFENFDSEKDIIKIDAKIPIDLDVIGYVDPGATVNIIRDGELREKRSIEMPALLKGVIKCKNPRCITSTEQELEHIFKLTDRENKVYRCIYCETKA